MKTREQIQEAHDIIHFALAHDGEPDAESLVQIMQMRGAHATLLWVLGEPCPGGEDHIEAFEVNLLRLRDAVAAVKKLN